MTDQRTRTEKQAAELAGPVAAIGAELERLLAERQQLADELDALLAVDDEPTEAELAERFAKVPELETRIAQLDDGWSAYTAQMETLGAELEQINTRPGTHRHDGDTSKAVPASKIDGTRLLCAGPRSHSDTTRDCRQWVAVAYRRADDPDLPEWNGSVAITNRWGIGPVGGTITNAQGETLDFEARSVCRKCGTVTYFDRAGNVIHSHG